VILRDMIKAPKFSPSKGELKLSAAGAAQCPPVGGRSRLRSGVRRKTPWHISPPRRPQLSVSRQRPVAGLPPRAKASGRRGSKTRPFSGTTPPFWPRAAKRRRRAQARPHGKNARARGVRQPMGREAAVKTRTATGKLRGGSARAKMSPGRTHRDRGDQFRGPNFQQQWASASVFRLFFGFGNLKDCLESSAALHEPHPSRL